MRVDEPDAYGRMITIDEGTLSAIVQARDCTAEQLAVQVVNAGVYRVDAGFLFDSLSKVDTENAQGEYYLTDIVADASVVDGGYR